MSAQNPELITPDLKGAIQRLSHACGEGLASAKALRVAGLSEEEAEAPLHRKMTALKAAALELIEIMEEDYGP